MTGCYAEQSYKVLPCQRQFAIFLLDCNIVKKIVSSLLHSGINIIFLEILWTSRQLANAIVCQLGTVDIRVFLPATCWTDKDGLELSRLNQLQ